MKNGVMRRGVMRRVDESQPGPVREKKLTSPNPSLLTKKRGGDDVAMSWT